MTKRFKDYSTMKDGGAPRRRKTPGEGTGQVADWANADGTLLMEAIAAVARIGGALRFGYTRDGGAYAIGIYGDGSPFTEYVKPVEDINAYLREIINDFKD